MDQLAPELLELIVGFVADKGSKTSFEDLKSLRLTSKCFLDLAAGPIFKKITFWISLPSLDKLCGVATHPILCVPKLMN